MSTSPQRPPVIAQSTPSSIGGQNIFGTIQDYISRSTKRNDKAVQKIQLCQSSTSPLTQTEQSLMETNALISIKTMECEQQWNANTSKEGTTQNENVPLHMELANTTTHQQDLQDTTPIQDVQLNLEPERSPPNSPVYRTPPSSIRSDSISDLNEYDIIKFNKI